MLCWKLSFMYRWGVVLGICHYAAEVLCWSWKAVFTQLWWCAGKLSLHSLGVVLKAVIYVQLRCCAGNLSLWAWGSVLELSLHGRGVVLESCSYKAEVLCWKAVLTQLWWCAGWEAVIIQLRWCAGKLSLYSWGAVQWESVIIQLRCCAGNLSLSSWGVVLGRCLYTAEVCWEAVIIQLRCCARKMSLYSWGVLGSCHYPAEVLC